MASAQVDVTQVEEFTKSPKETTLGSSPTIEKAPPSPNIESPYGIDDDEDVSLPDEIDKAEDEVDDDDDQKAVGPQIIEDEDDEDDDEEQVSKSEGRETDFSEEEGEERD